MNAKNQRMLFAEFHHLIGNLDRDPVPNSEWDQAYRAHCRGKASGISSALYLAQEFDLAHPFTELALGHHSKARRLAQNLENLL